MRKAAGIDGRRAGGEQRKLDVVARCEGQRRDGMGIDDAADFGALRLQQRSFAGDFDRGADRTDLHDDVNACGLVQDQSEGRMHGGLETFGFHFEIVRANGNTNDVVDAVLIGDGRPVGATIGVVSRDSGADKGRAARIGDGTGYGCSYILGPGRVGAGQKREQRNAQKN